MFKKIFKFFTKDVWHISLDEKTTWYKIIIKQIRIFLLAFRGFAEDKVQLRASALTFYSLLAIVPLFAMIFGIAKGFGLEKSLEDAINEKFAIEQVVGETEQDGKIYVQEEVLEKIMNFKDNMLGKASGGWMAVIGFLVLIWSVMKVLGNIENSFNNIWQIKKSRGISRKFSDYLSLLIIAPILFIISSTANISNASNNIQNTFIISWLGPALNIILWIISFTSIWFVFTLLYIVIPNTKVKFLPAFFGGAIAGTLFQLMQLGYAELQIYLSGYRTVYGVFAALPLFIIWLQYSWLIVLFGAELAFAYQNIENYEFETDSLHISSHNRKLLSLLIVQVIVKNFVSAKPALISSKIAELLDVPIRIVREIIYELIDAGILSETITQHDKENAYQPAIDPGILSIGYVIEKLEKRGHNTLHVENSKEFDKLSESLELVYSTFEKSPKNSIIKDL